VGLDCSGEVSEKLEFLIFCESLIFDDFISHLDFDDQELKKVVINFAFWINVLFNLA
jgi:hypothetical protein